MFEVISNLNKALSLIKKFKSGYRGSDAYEGYMVIEHNDKRYAVKLVEMNNADQESDFGDAIEHTKKYFKEKK